MQKEDTLPLDKLATGELLDSKTAWMEHWNQGPDRKVMEDKWDKAFRKEELEILLQKHGTFTMILYTEEQLEKAYKVYRIHQIEKDLGFMQLEEFRILYEDLMAGMM